MEPCNHPRFSVTTEVKIHQDEIEHETDPAKRFIFRGRTIEIKVMCSECFSPMKFLAPNVQFSLKGLTICKDAKNPESPEDSMLVCPIEPCSAEPVLVKLPELGIEQPSPLIRVLPEPPKDEPAAVSKPLASHIARWFKKKGIQ